MGNILLKFSKGIEKLGIGKLLSRVLNICGPLFVIGFYTLIYYHIRVFCTVIIAVLFKRLGVAFSLMWMMAGGVIGLNVVFNYTMAMIIKANGPKEIKKIEVMRSRYKNRQTKKEMRESERYEGISSEVKQTMRYRAKSLDDLRHVW